MAEYHVVVRDDPWCWCGRAATHEVRNSRNEVMSRHCNKHAQERADDLNAGHGMRAARSRRP